MPFDEGLWLNVGPGRIPHHHVHVIDYCRQFGVALQPYIFTSRANRVHTGHVGNGRTWQMRQAVHDLQGHIAELLSKCVSTNGIDLPLSKTDIEKFQDLLMYFGGLTKSVQSGTTSYSYKNQTGRAGFERSHGVGNKPLVPLDPVSLDEILRSDLWNDFIFRDSEIQWQASLMEPVGGMDRFVKAFAAQSLSRQTGTIGGAGALRRQGDGQSPSATRGCRSSIRTAVSRACSPPTTASRPSRCRCSRISRPIWGWTT